MPELRATPYIWVTWLTKLLVGENSCEWAAWFRSQHESWSYEKVQSTFDATTWQLNHTALLNQIRTRLEGENETDCAYTTLVENKTAMTTIAKICRISTLVPEPQNYF